MPEIECIHCGNDNPRLISKYLEPRDQRPEPAKQPQKFYCEVCGKFWETK